MTSSKIRSAPSSVQRSRRKRRNSTRCSRRPFVRRHGLDQHGREVLAARGDEALERALVVERQHGRVLRVVSAARRPTTACRTSRAPSPRRPERVRVAVVAARELDDHVLLVKPRATRTALMTASVPDDTKRTFCAPG
jgi:hypothetical protein